jgi:hypothetical protein
MWLDTLKAYTDRHPIIILQFTESEWQALLDSRRGPNEFTIARPHSFFTAIKMPAPCLIIGQFCFDDLEGRLNNEECIYFGLLSSKSAITTLESRAKVSRAIQISLSSRKELISLVTAKRHAENFSTRIQSEQSIIPLSPKLSVYLIDRLASIHSNRGAMRSVAESLAVPKKFTGNSALQEDAVQTALATFGLTAHDHAIQIELMQGKETALGRVKIMEDSVVEHDARSVPGYALIHSGVTGRALFQKGNEQLEVFTANRRDLEHCLGVDLIYVNLTKQNIVMLQYKMLEPNGKIDEQTDWVYRPDSQLDDEIARMETFANVSKPAPKEYRLNSEIFYLKFVKRDAKLANGGIIIPLDHFQKLRSEPEFKGPRNGLRFSYRTLNGRYLRQTPFIEMIRCGYIGAHAEITNQLKILIDEILSGNKAVVTAIQEKIVK